MKLCIKPYIGAIKPPRDYKQWDAEELSKPPEVKSDLDYIHGYRAKDQRNNIKFLKNNNIVYTAAAVCIQLDTKTNIQRFFNKHGDDITAMAVNPDGIRIATGETGVKPFVYVWNSLTLEVVNTFKGVLTKGIDLLAFSRSGEKLAATGRDGDHTIAVYDLTNTVSVGGCLIIDQKGGRDIMLEMVWKDDMAFITVGPKHFKVWTITDKLQQQNQAGKAVLQAKDEKLPPIKNKNAQKPPLQPLQAPQKSLNPEYFLAADKGSWGKNACSDKLNTVTINGADAVAGAMDGTLQIFSLPKGDLLQFKKLHSRGIQAVFTNQKYFFTGGNDGIVNVLDKKSYALILKIDEKTYAGSLCPKIRAITMHPNERQLIIGTYASEIYELTCKDPTLNGNSVFIPKVLVTGHYTPNQNWTNEVWGLQTFPRNNDLYASCADDATLRIWSSSLKKQLFCISTNLDEKGQPLPPDPKTKDLQDQSKGRSLAISPDENFIILGCLDGTIRVYSKTLKQIKVFKHSEEEISDVKVSPNGKLLAIGSHDNMIYIYDLPSFERKFKPLNKHSSYITHLDFSEDSLYMQSTCGAYELLFWDLKKGRQLPSGASQLRDEKWSTFSCPIGWPVQGIFKKGYDGTDINCVARSNMPIGGRHPNNYQLLATGDDYSNINIQKFPSLKYGSQGVVNRGHSSHVTNVKFSNDDKKLYSTGGEDQTVMQWTLMKKKFPMEPTHRSNSEGRARGDKYSKYFKH